MAAESNTPLSKTERPKRLKNQVVEPESCSICSEKYTTILRKKIICKYCQSAACCKCVEQYLLTRHEDAHCLHCRVNYNDTTLQEICTRTYLQQTYFKHRQDVLINRERANLPLLQDAAVREKRRRERLLQEAAMKEHISALNQQRDVLISEHNRLYVQTYGEGAPRDQVTFAGNVIKLQESQDHQDEIYRRIRDHRHLLYQLRWANNGANPATEESKEEEKKKFVRRCTRTDCKGFLSTAWKCGICEWYSCHTCFAVKGDKHDTPHECKKEDIETADLIRKDCKPCPKCGEFIEKSSGCDQMFCISCQTPFSWITGKIVTSGPIHNPHYYEWMKRSGGAVPRNPADVPCGGFPGGWELARCPRGIQKHTRNIFYEFHRICMEIQDIFTRQYRSHIDQEASNSINIKFLLGEIDEKNWGRLLAVQEKKRKRDAEIQEVFGAFRMVAVELINRVQQYNDGTITSFTDLPIKKAEEFLTNLNVEIKELINMINDALRTVSIVHSYSVPYIKITWVERNQNDVFSISTRNFKTEVKQTRVKKNEEKTEETSEEKTEEIIDDTLNPENMTETEQIQFALLNSLQ